MTTTAENVIDTTLCFECGTDTQYDGYVNRIPCDRDNLECYKCGPCNDTEEAMTARSAEDFDDDKWDAYMADRIKYVDQKFPDAPKFREFMETESIWTEADITQVQRLIDSYRKEGGDSPNI
tara:strand:- start:155 stop:520 length:366 start_codon:yes stop_codon:yes gene_type:complete